MKLKYKGRIWSKQTFELMQTTQDIKVGVVIGHYNNLMAIRLNLKAIRDHCGEVPILIGDDCSDGFTEKIGRYSIYESLLQLVSDDPNVYLWPNPARIGHAGGDCSAIWKGIIWAKHLGLDCFAKLSQRFIITLPGWLSDAAKKLMQVDFSIMGKTGPFHRFPIRTEALVFKTRDWYQEAILNYLTPRNLGEIQCEFMINNCINFWLDNKVLLWEILSNSRPEKAPGILFREANPIEDYQNMALLYGIPWDESFSCMESHKMKNYLPG